MIDAGGGAPLAVDLFCGRGGWTRGLMAAGFRVVGYDVEAQPDYPGEFVRADVRDLSGADLGSPAVVVASFPCVGFSLVNPARLTYQAPGAGDLELLCHALRLIEDARPTWWAVENVRGAVGWVNSIIGAPRLKAAPFYIWGHFPPFLLEQMGMPAKKSHHVGGVRFRRAAALAAEIPGELARPFSVACMDGLRSLAAAGENPDGSLLGVSS